MRSSPEPSQSRRPARSPVAVIGEGVIGLTTTVRLVEAGRSVVVYSQGEPATMASLAAGAYWWPHEVEPPERVAAWAERSLAVYAELARDPASGVDWHEHRRLEKVADRGGYARRLLPEGEELDPSELVAGCRRGFRCRVPRIDPPAFLAYLKSRLAARGASFVRRRLRSIDELTGEHRLIVNCAGLGARELVDDPTLYPIRGQTVRVSRVDGLTSSVRLIEHGEAFTLLLPRARDLLLGGTAQVGDDRLEPDLDDVRGVLERCGELAPKVRDLEVLETRVGLRPGRAEVRVEIEVLGEGRTVIHNYGHGGAGFTVAWGCADEVVELARPWLGEPATG